MLQVQDCASGINPCWRFEKQTHSACARSVKLAGDGSEEVAPLGMRIGRDHQNFSKT